MSGYVDLFLGPFESGSPSNRCEPKPGIGLDCPRVVGVKGKLS